MKFEWKPKNSIGVGEFDRQHKHFFELASEMSELAESADIDQKALLMKMVEFGDYALYHLDAEEEYFEKYGYEDAVPHTAAHNVYRDRVKEFKLEVEDQEVEAKIKAIARDFAEFSARWLTKHIMEIDKKYEPFFREKGLK